MEPTICLNMIVKNESKNIVRLLNSVKSIINSVLICDTGSTDGTPKVITDWLCKNSIEGHVIYKEFVNFGENRTYSLKKAQQLIKSDYLLFMDADMILRIGKDFNKNYLTKDSYYLLQGSDHFNYYNVRLIKSSLNAEYFCPTHEYLSTNAKETENMPKELLFIDDIGDGGSKSNKYTRDIQLLSDALVNEPTNGRYLFYLANSYHDSGDITNAIKYYQKLVTIGSWVEEVFYSYLRLGNCYQQLGDEDSMTKNYVKGYSVLPKRAESLYELIKYHRIKGNHHLCQLYYNTAKDIPYPADCSLFIHKDIYDYKLLEEYTIFGYYTGHRNLSSEMFELMKKKPMHELYQLFSNYRFYCKIPTADKVVKLNDEFPEFKKSFYGEEYSFVASTPSIVPNGNNGEYIINIRFVNYRIKSNGEYPWYKHITTINKMAIVDSEFETIGVTPIKHELEERNYIGVEDIKLTVNNGYIYYTGTSLLSNGNIGTVYGVYSNTITISELKTKNQSECEKNWVFVPTTDNQIRMIYSWYPLTIGTVNEDSELVIDTTNQMPQLFSMARGSTNGFIFKEQIWFLVHYVHQSPGEPRNYYHSLVVFDMDMELVKYSKPFKFTNNSIEYACGLVVEEERIIVTHSVWDRESYIRTYPSSEILCLFE